MPDQAFTGTFPGPGAVCLVNPFNTQMENKLSNAFGRVYLTIRLDRINRWVRATWEGFLTEASVQSGAQALTEVVEASGFSCLLSDVRQVLGPIRSAEWAAQEWAFEAGKAGIRYMALVYDPDSMAVSDVSTFHCKQIHFCCEIFVSIEEGERWLAEAGPLNPGQK